MLEVKIFTLYPDLFPGPLDMGIYKKAQESKIWNLKIINHHKAKYCSGYVVYPRNFKKFVKELSDLMGVEINIE